MPTTPVQVTPTDEGSIIVQLSVPDSIDTVGGRIICSRPPVGIEDTSGAKIESLPCAETSEGLLDTPTLARVAEKAGTASKTRKQKSFCNAFFIADSN